MLLNTSKALLVGSLVWVGVTPLAQSELKTFQPGDVIKSSEMIRLLWSGALPHLPPLSN